MSVCVCVYVGVGVWVWVCGCVYACAVVDSGSPFVPRVLYDAVIEHRAVAVVLDGYAERTLLQYVYKKGHLDAAEIVDIAAQLLSALADIHGRGAFVRLVPVVVVVVVFLNCY
jgi:hypothetical protein